MSTPTMTTVLGGKEMEVTFLDGNKKIVRVRQLPLKLMGQYAVALDNDERLVELYAGEEPGFAEHLETGSQLEVLEMGDSLNFPNFQRWFAHRRMALEKMGTNVTKAVEEAVKSQMISQASASQSPTGVG